MKKLIFIVLSLLVPAISTAGLPFNKASSTLSLLPISHSRHVPLLSKNLIKSNRIHTQKCASMNEAQLFARNYLKNIKTALYPETKTSLDAIQPDIVRNTASLLPITHALKTYMIATPHSIRNASDVFELVNRYKNLLDKVDRLVKTKNVFEKKLLEYETTLKFQVRAKQIVRIDFITSKEKVDLFLGRIDELHRILLEEVFVKYLKAIENQRPIPSLEILQYGHKVTKDKINLYLNNLFDSVGKSYI